MIKEINHRSVKTVKEYAAQMAKLKKNDTVQLFIWRMNAGFVVVKLTK